ncbi:hypothetical protein HHK36_005868 [Tetracentron sinense]|uniref:Retrotransposon Copia-like N-terminal domain-containing protein n=1 Tax=Tetracentron sinense TaxID=13715 RepID=A0A835DR15_TETSI|nr:hypothetical protein HHK36_005868 [Tetracentron sinense]
MSTEASVSDSVSHSTNMESSPYHLQSGDSPGAILVSNVLTEENYHTWSRSMMMALKAKKKIGFVNGSIVRPAATDACSVLWERCNNMEFTPWKMIGIARKSAGLYILQQSGAYAVEFPPKSNTNSISVPPKPVPDYNEIPYPEPLQSEIPSLDSVIPTSTDLPLHDENQFPPLRKSTRQHKMPGYLQNYHCNLAASASQSSTRDPATNPEFFLCSLSLCIRDSKEKAKAHTQAVNSICQDDHGGSDRVSCEAMELYLVSALFLLALSPRRSQSTCIQIMEPQVINAYQSAIIGPNVVVIIVIGNSAVILGLWPAHVLWTYYCVAKTKRLGMVLKILLLISLPVPMVLWPIFGIIGSLLAGVGYGIFTPLIATFEAVGEKVTDKLLHCSVDGCWSTLEGSCTAVRDFTDFCFHSYFSYMDELSDKVPTDEKPIDIRLSKLPSCLFVSLLAVPIDVLLITAVALWKSPCMLFKGWQRLFEDLIGREGPFLELVCVPFAGLAVILWPIVVVGAIITAFICSFFLGFYAGVVVHQEDSLRMGLAYIVSVVSLFDEYTNDLLYLSEGSCLPSNFDSVKIFTTARPKYHRNMSPPSEQLERRKSIENSTNHQKNGSEGPYGPKLVSERSRTLKWTIQQLKPMQVWDWLFRSCEVHGRILLRDGLITIIDIEECIVKGNCKKLGIKLPAWSILQCLLTSAKSDTSGLIISDEVELTRFDLPNDKVFEWFIGPLLIMKEQIKGLQLDENEEACLSKLIMECNNESPEDWDDTGFPSNDKVRRAQLQAIIRRMQGLVASMSRIPTFRRRFKNLVKVLYMEAVETGAMGNQDGGSSKTRYGGKRLVGHEDKRNEDAAGDEARSRTYDNGNIV